MNQQQVAETLALIKAQQLQPNANADAVQKAFSQATGLVNYDLQPVALNLYPVLTPLRNRIPRVPGNGGTGSNWKAITGINTASLSAGVSEGQRGGVIATSTQDFMANYKGIGLEDSVTFEADYAAQGFDDVKAKAALGLLRSTMIQEERITLLGNSSINLGTTPTPTLAGSTTGGTLATGTLSVIAVALTGEALRAATVSGGIQLGFLRNNADGTTDQINGGHAIKSAAATVAITGPTGSATASVPVVNGALGYAWFWGAAGSEVLGAVTALNSVAITANATGTQAASAVGAGADTGDQSKRSLIFDGLATQIQTPGSGSYNVALPTGVAGTGTPFTSDGAGGIVEIDTAFAWFWDNLRLSPEIIWCSGKTLNAVSKLVIANGGAPLIRYDGGAGGNGMTAGTVVTGYLNKITNTTVQIKVHPDMPDGVLMFYSESIPYPLSGVGNVLQYKCRKDYYQTEWPLRTRKYEYGVYADEVLQNYFPPAFGLLRNIKV